jgi:hypothetical protein
VARGRYEALRASPLQHQGFLVAEKKGEEAEMAIEDDPRGE